MADDPGSQDSVKPAGGLLLWAKAILVLLVGLLLLWAPVLYFVPDLITVDTDEIWPPGVVILLLLPLGSGYVIKRALARGPSARWILLWFVAIVSFVGIIPLGIYAYRREPRHLQEWNRGDPHPESWTGLAVIAAMSILFFPLSPLLIPAAIAHERSAPERVRRRKRRAKVRQQLPE